MNAVTFDEKEKFLSGPADGDWPGGSA